MSIFDQSFHNRSGWCGSINNHNNDNNGDCGGLPAVFAPQHHRGNNNNNNEIDDDLMTPADRQKKREIDNILSQAMKGLSFEERQEQQEILHGVDQKIAEEETFIEASLQQLEFHLAKIKSHSVYEVAERMDPNYVRARAFRIMFLRGNRYNVKKSADNMLHFFEVKSQLFGVEKLVKDITLEDLDEDDIAALKTGFLQLPGKKDSSGRIILLNFPGLRGTNMSLNSELRMRFYILMSALEKEENQLSHFVTIVFSLGNMKDKFGGNGLFENAKVSMVSFSSIVQHHGQFFVSSAKLYVISYLFMNALAGNTEIHGRVSSLYR